MRKRIASLLNGISKSSMVKKALLIYLIFIFLPSCLLMYGYYQKTSAILERDMSASMLQTLKQAEYNISGRLELIENISDGFIANPDVFGFLSDLAKPSYLQYGDFQALEKLVGSGERNRDVRQIRIFVQPELLYANESLHFFPLRNVQSESWYAKIKARNGAVYWGGTHLQSYLGGDAAYVASAARVLHDPTNYDKVIGALVIDVKEQLLRQILDHIELAPSQEVFIIDKEGMIVSYRDHAKIGTPSDLSAEQISSIQGHEDGYFKSDAAGAGITVLYRHIPLSEWTIVAKLPSAEMSGESIALTKISAVIILAGFSIVFILILVLAFAYAAERLSRRIRELILTLKTEGIGRLDSRSSSDLRELEQGVARMVQTVHDLTAESYQAKLLERDAQLNALQAQINPHFLYNTLDSIHWMAIRRHADDISDMIESLSAYFRQSLSKGRYIVTLDEELQLIRSYMYIQNKRNDDGIHMVYRIDDAALVCCIPKMIIQPLVENSVLHGINQKRPKHGVITITAALDKDNLIIIVQDDGVGISAERLEKLLDAPADPAAIQNFGLYNVHERIRLYSRNEPGCGLTIVSEPGNWTRVSLLMKITGPRPNGLTG
ncbi:cache domain-containing sensor histidine kinase [Paenibacillus thalictri]|uniref:Sensor histidine kinase n=1 Tax=Paenibacillus thalictri TaxID=2527873 RepID=A0A4Q9DGN2_9BACL|nr:sensor histidine kinase [Paenibacillus thalictri]TBL70399.1 sensor histidine kinase [Paenibacillus thalictri]